MKDTENRKVIKMKLSGKSTSSGQLTIKSRAYFSTYHLWPAEHFSKLAGDIEDSHEGRSKFNLEHRVYVINSILSAVAFLEAAVNELFQDAHDKHLVYLGHLDETVISILSDFWEMTEEDNKSFLSILDKYQLALRFAGKEPFQKGENPYQDNALVIKLRNYLTHYKPMNLSEIDKHSLDKMLIGKFLPNKMMEGSGNNFFPDKALSKGCAEWCLRSVRNFADEYFEKMEIEPNDQKVDMNKLAGKK